MLKHHVRKRVVCATAAVLLTGLSSTVFVSAEPRALENGAESNAAAFKADPALVERGRYLVRTAGCNDCHTPGYALSGGQTDEQQWLIGDALGWQGPWGTTYPINVRLFMEKLTAEQWLQVARNPARPPMPWFALRDMTDRDLLALYHYVRHLGPAGKPAPDYVPPGQPAKTPVVKYPAG